MKILLNLRQLHSYWQFRDSFTSDFHWHAVSAREIIDNAQTKYNEYLTVSKFRIRNVAMNFEFTFKSRNHHNSTDEEILLRIGSDRIPIRVPDEWQLHSVPHADPLSVLSDKRFT